MTGEDNLMRKVISALLGVLFIAMFFALAVTAQSSETDAAIKAAYGTPKLTVSRMIFGLPPKFRKY